MKLLYPKMVRYVYKYLIYLLASIKVREKQGVPFSRDKNSEQMLSILSLKFVKFFVFQKMNIVRYFGLFEIHPLFRFC